MPSSLDTLFAAGLHALQHQRAAHAAEQFRAALALAPNHPVVQANLGLALEQQGQLDAAEACYRQALAADVSHSELFLNLGGLLTRQRRLEEAEAVYQAALAHGHATPALYSNLGVLYAILKRDEPAEVCYQQALALQPDYPTARFNLGYLYLRRGDYAQGWACLEARDWYQALAQVLPWPRWQGEPLAGRAVLIGLEAGQGDMIQFCRYASQLKAAGARRVGVLCHPPLARLFARLEGVDQVYPLGAELDQDWDCWTPPLSLPYYFHTRLDSIPAALPYLHADPALQAHWASHLPARADGWRVGLVWKGNPRFENDAERSLPGLHTLAALADLPGIQWISLQKGAGEDQAQAADAPFAVHALGPQLKDFADTAAVLAQLDLLISVDTASAHLAGALAVPCWVMLPDYQTDWRWLQQRSDSPWYPGCVRLFRQPQRGDWASVVSALRAALASWGPGTASR